MKARKMTPRDFAPHLMLVLGNLTKNTANVSIPMEETFNPVCVRMGINVTEFGESQHGTERKKTPWVHRQIGLAFRQLRDKGFGSYVKRGHWNLTEEGVEELKSLDTPSAPTVADLAAAKVQASEEGVEESNLVHLSEGPPEHPYSDDPYIRGLAVQKVACFGAHSVRSDVCKSCLLATDCIAAIQVRMSEIATEIEREEHDAKKAAEEKERRSATQNASIDELIGAMDGEGPADGQGGKFKPAMGPNAPAISKAGAHRESVCAQCGEKIAKGSDCYWVEEEGVFHPQCIEAPLDAG